MTRVVDPQPPDERLAALAAEYGPRLETARAAVAVAVGRRARMRAKRSLRRVQREYHCAELGIFRPRPPWIVWFGARRRRD